MRNMLLMSFSCSTAVSSSRISTRGSFSRAFISCTICRSAVRRCFTGTDRSTSHWRKSFSCWACFSSLRQLMKPLRVS